ncbi:DUF4811 domain-containing protein [Nicoliella spurrieriana]|uniref:DUF4811 domain-containing protein n=1 Tax=Nicoliella spurrieriana TaxID=2925830 RepID=A0A976RSM0_9LACO|nr:DUF4811 domain-containing protein [Nicoliella spurrieriana]UQS87082.1 DUF4811 domain-containing protein [Nicoliella spurrieriana]
MIIALLVIIAVLFFLSWNLVSKQPLHFILNVIFTALLIGVMSLSVANFKYHYGMHKVTTTTMTTKVASLSPELSMVVDQPVGQSNSKDKALVYKSGSSKRTLKPDTDVTNVVVKQGNLKHAKLVTKTTRWEYKNGFERFMYNFAQKPSVYHRTNVLYVPKNWMVLNAKQVKALPTIMKQEQAKMQKQASGSQAQQQAMLQQQVQAYVQKQLAQATKENPSMSAKEKQAVVKQATANGKKQVMAQAKQAALQKMLPQVQKQLDTIK